MKEKKKTIQTKAVLTLFRSSRQMYSVRNDVLLNFTKFTGKHLYQRPGLRPATILKKRLWHRCFPVNFEKFLRAPFLQNPSRRLFLTFNRCWFKKPSLLMTSFHCVISNFEKKNCSIVNKRLSLLKFSQS